MALVSAGPSLLLASVISFSLSQGAEHLELRALVRVPESNDRLRFAISSSGLRGISWMSRATQISDTWFEVSSQGGSHTSFRAEPDSLVLDRVYPSFVAGEKVGILNLDYWILEEPLRRQTLLASFPAFFIGSGCKTHAETYVDRGTGIRVDGRGRFVALAIDDSVCQVVDGLTLIDTGTTPRWIRELAVSESDRFAKIFAQRFQMVLPKPTLYLHADLDRAQRSEFRGEAAWRQTIFLRFFGDAWTEFDDRATERISKFVAHEVLHLWIGKTFYQAPNTQHAWLSEGAAEYLSLTAQEDFTDPSSQQALNEVSERLTSCLRTLGDKSMTDPAASRGSAPYDCGYALQWLVDIHDRRIHDRSIWERWRGYLASRLDREISWEGFLAWGMQAHSASALVSPLFESTTYDNRVSALSARLKELDLRLETPVLDNPRTIRRLVLFHLLGQVCDQGDVGFRIHEDSLELNTGDRCGVLSGNPRVKSLDGYDLLSPNTELHAHLSSVCHEQGEVKFAGPSGAQVASLVCEERLPPPPRRVRISTADTSG